MKTSLYHIQINVHNAKVSLPFYKRLFAYFEYTIIDESDEHIGVSNGTTDFWIIETEDTHKEKGYHRKAIGLNHIAFRVSSKEDVDSFVKEFLKKEKVKILYDTPGDYPEYKKGYYAVFFEDPDRVKIEVAYVPSEAYIGLIIEESLEDNQILNDFKIRKVEITKDRKVEDRWHMYTIEASHKEIERLSKGIKGKLWYADFWKENEGLIVFRNKIFRVDPLNKKSWKEAIEYGLALGIPKKQLDFKSRI